MSGAAATRPASMADIVTLARTYAARGAEADELAARIRAAARKALSPRMRLLQSRLAEKAAAGEALRDAIASRPDLFARPRTQAVDGVKFGLRKQPGAVTVRNEARAIERLRRLLPEHAAACINVKESLDRKALRKLAAGELAQIGVRIDSVADEVTISEPASDCAKLMAALIEDHKRAEGA